MTINYEPKKCFLINSGAIISMVTLKDYYSDDYYYYLAKEVEKRFKELEEEKGELEFDGLYNILNDLEEIEEIQVLNSFVIEM